MVLNHAISHKASSYIVVEVKKDYLSQRYFIFVGTLHNDQIITYYRSETFIKITCREVLCTIYVSARSILRKYYKVSLKLKNPVYLTHAIVKLILFTHTITVL